MLRWKDVIKLGTSGNPKPDLRVEKTAEEWRELLPPEQFHITREAGTERRNSSPMCRLFEPGQYACVCCGTLLFDSGEKFNSGTGWPSFTQPIKEDAIAYHIDSSYGMTRVEVTCNVCDAHLGHVFQNGPEPSGLRYCINALSLNKIHAAEGGKAEASAATETPKQPAESKATFGGGCFWCTEAIFQQLKGVKKVESGYSGGDAHDPTYHEVCSGETGHAEVIEVTYDPTQITFEDLLRVHMSTHNPTSLNKQGADTGTQYRSIIFYRDAKEKAVAERTVVEYRERLGKRVFTEIKPFEQFYRAESSHQNYYRRNEGTGYCESVIEPKLARFREKFAHLLPAKSAAGM